MFNGTTWDRSRSATADALASTGMAASGLMGFNGATWDRLRTSSLASDIGAVKTNFAFSYKNITTNDNTTVKSGAGILHTLVIGTIGTTSSVIVYDSTTAAGTIIGTFSTVLQNTLVLDVNFTTGLTVAPSGGAAANLTFSYK